MSDNEISSYGRNRNKIIPMNGLKQLLIRENYLEKKKIYENELIDDSAMRPDHAEKLRDDFYAITFMSYVFIDDQNEILDLDDHLRRKRLGESEVARNLMNCNFIWIMQLSLLAISWMSISAEYENDAAKESEKLTERLKLLNFDVIITRLACAIILHLQISGEVCQAIKLMKFTIYRTASWNRRLPQFWVAFMQLVGALLTEGLCIYLMCKQSEPGEIIMNLLAFAVIAEIDDFYAKSLANHFGRELVDEGYLRFSKIAKEDG